MIYMPSLKIIEKLAKQDNYSRYALTIIIIAFFLYLVLATLTSVSGDACWHLSVAKYIAATGSVPLFEPLGRDVFWAPPLFHVLTAANYKVIGFLGEVALKLVSPIAGTLLLLYSFLLIRKLFGPRTAFYSTLFLAFIPVQIYQSSLAYADELFAFLVTASVYYAVERRLAVSSVIFGLGLLAKTNTIFAFPAIIYIIYRGFPSEWKKRALTFILIALAIGAVWYIRNWIYLGNPVWPFMNGIFHGYESITVTSFSPNLDVAQAIITFYLSLFGVPNGNVSNLLVVGSLPIILAWLTVTIAFLSPFFLGIRPKKMFNFNVINLLFVSMFLFQVVMSLNISTFQTRYILPALTFFSLYWALGVERISRNAVLRKMAVVFLIVAVAVFVFGEFKKVSTASEMWSTYEKDFSWIQENIPPDAVILTPNSQCNSYKLGRSAVGEWYVLSNKTFYALSYIFYPEINDSLVLSRFATDVMSRFNSTLIYENNSTAIRIYEINNNPV